MIFVARAISQLSDHFSNFATNGSLTDGGFKTVQGYHDIQLAESINKRQQYVN